MGRNVTESKPLPVVDYLKIPEKGQPYLEGYKCKKCRDIFLEKEMSVPSALQETKWK